MLSERAAKLGVVFDNSVVDDGDFAVAGEMRVRVRFRYSPVGGPAGMAEAGAAFDRSQSQPGIEGGHLPDGLFGSQSVSVLDDHPRRVIAAVLEAMKPVDEDIHRVALP